MSIREKTPIELASDKDMVLDDIFMGTIRNDLHWALTHETYHKYLNKSKKINKQREIFEKDGTLVLRIWQNKVINNNFNWTSSTGANTLIEFWEYKKYLHAHKNLKHKEIKDLRILVQHDNGSYELDIPNFDKRHMLQFLIDGIPPIEFDCQSFIHTMKWVKMRSHSDNGSILPNKRRMDKVTLNSLKPWDCICLFNHFSHNDLKYNWVKHFAYCLWNGLFISKFWMGGHIVITNLQEMHNFYGTKEFVSMTPNPNHEDVTNIYNNTIH